MLRKLRFLALALPVVLAGCDSPTDTNDGTFAGSVATAQRLWDAQGLDDYEFRYVADCFCAIAPGETIVTVLDDRVVAVQDARTGRRLPEALQYTPTIEQLLASIADAERTGTYVQAQYDRRWGYPVDAVIGDLSLDAGVGHHLRDLRAVDLD